MAVPPAYPPIGDYGAIGDCRTLALVSRRGSIDWWCPPRFDAPSVFGRLLDWSRGGSFHVEAAELAPAGRRYLPGSAVLETRVRASGGELVITDFLAIHAHARGGADPAPYARQKLVRLIRCRRGTAPLTVVCRPRPDYGRRTPRLILAGPADASRRTLRFAAGTRRQPRQIGLGATVPWGRLSDGEARLEITLTRGEEIGVVIDYGPGDMEGEGVRRGHHRASQERRGYELAELHHWLAETLDFWRRWTARNRYRGPYRDEVRRSAVTLKLLTYHPSGATVAAGTTSLPEEIGGERNWDYRFTWLRDSTFTLYALHTLGYRAESDAFMRWLTAACRQDAEPRVLYRVDGSAPGRERRLAELEGYRGSRPVRVGNAAAAQRQLDLYGAVLDAAYLDVRAGNRMTEPAWQLMARLADRAARRWRLPDASIWEVRGGQRHFTYSKVMCWVALDRALRLAEMVGHRTDPARLARWRRAAEAIRTAVFERGRRADGAFAQSFGSQRVDASALVFPLVGFVHGDAPATAATLRAVERELAHDGLVRRYVPDEEVEGVAGREGGFLICSYWLCDNLALRGDLREARRRFEQLGRCANDLGLFSEEWDAAGRQALGNFPQAFTHIALISSAHNLERAAAGRMHGHVRGAAPHDAAAPRRQAPSRRADRARRAPRPLSQPVRR